MQKYKATLVAKECHFRKRERKIERGREGVGGRNDPIGGLREREEGLVRVSQECTMLLL